MIKYTLIVRFRRDNQLIFILIVIINGYSCDQVYIDSVHWS